MVHTEYITFNGHREVIKYRLPVLRQLKKEGWTVSRPRFYYDFDKKKRDYVTILVYKDFNL